MVRYEIDNDGGPIHVAYGSDEIVGMFLSVSDRRLRTQQDSPDEVNELLGKLGTGDGGGGYLNLYTGPTGIGQKVSKEAMAVFMRRYGVPEERIRELWRMYHEGHGGLKSTTFSSLDEMLKKVPFRDSPYFPQSSVHFDPTKFCVYCNKEAKMRCGKCNNLGQLVLYCSKECQKSDWADHKHFCALPFPEKKIVVDEKKRRHSVYALLLEENEVKPKIVELPIHGLVFCEDAFFPGVERGGHGYSYIRSNPVKAGRVLDDEFVVEYRDEFLKDGSAPNKCVQAITGNVFYHAWAGPILIVKHKGITNDERYTDFALADGGNIIDFFKAYGSRG